MSQSPVEFRAVRQRVMFRSAGTRPSWWRGLNVSLCRLGFGAVAVIIGTAASNGAAAAPGQLDTTFAVGGVATTQFGTANDSRAQALAIQPDGMIVAAGTGNASHFALARFDTTGSLDPSFGVGGRVVADIGGLFEEAYAVALQADGRIVAAGTTAPGGFCCQVALARLTADGRLDASFGVGGRVVTPLSGMTQAGALAIQADGKIVAAGGTFDPFSQDCIVFRYNTDGSLDAEFGSGGKVKTDFGGYDSFSGVAIQADGKIVAAGAGAPNHDFIVARYNPDGSLDSGFGTAGEVITDLGSYDRAECIAIQPDQKLVAAGTGYDRFGIARWNPDGSPDSTFGTGGQVTAVMTGENVESATGVAIQADGSIVATGWAFRAYAKCLALMRLLPNGAVDTSFGAGGRVTDIFPGHGQDEADAIVLQADGRIVVGGGYGPGTPSGGFVIARYLGGSSNHSPDCTAARASVSSIWPPDYRWVPIGISGITDPDGDEVAVRVTRVTQDEPLNGDDDAHGRGRGDDSGRRVTAAGAEVGTEGGSEALSGDDEAGSDHCPDALIDSGGRVAVRAERNGHGDGRVYEIEFMASDGRGGVCDGSVQVCVPGREHRQHGGEQVSCVDNGQRYNSLGPCHAGHERSGPPSRVPTLTQMARSGSATALEYSLPSPGDVSIVVFDVAGRRVATLTEGAQYAGTHAVTWDARGNKSGIYFCRMQVGSLTIRKSILILK